MKGDILDAVRSGNLARVKEIVTADPATARTRNSQEEPCLINDALTMRGVTPLHYAIFQNNIEIAQVLIAAGADLNAGTDNPDAPESMLFGGITPLHVALTAEAADVLVKSGANPESKAEGGRTPLHLWATGGNAAMCEKLIGYGANPNCLDKDGWAPLHRVKNVATAAVLLDHGADVNLRTTDVGWTPLHQIALMGAARQDVWDYLVSRGADVNAPAGGDSQTPMDHRKYTSYHEASRMLSDETDALVLARARSHLIGEL